MPHPVLLTFSATTRPPRSQSDQTARRVSRGNVTLTVQHGGVTGGPRRPGSDLAATLDDLQARLERHFRALRAARDRSRTEAPIFALEHGLAAGDLAVLNDSVRGWIAAYRPTRRLWLPFVVYATEVGYQYEGDEYWPTLAARTPGWERHGNREVVSRWFRDFAKEFGGAIPRGRWASHFRIICWPITHAVLPATLRGSSTTIAEPSPRSCWGPE